MARVPWGQELPPELVSAVGSNQCDCRTLIIGSDIVFSNASVPLLWQTVVDLKKLCHGELLLVLANQVSLL